MDLERHHRADRRGPWPETVSDLMRDDVVTIDPNASVRELARILVKQAISIAAVVDAKGMLLGTVGVTDLIWLADRLVTAAGPWRSSTRDGLAGVSVRNIMSRDVLGVPADETLPGLLRFFSRTGLHRAPVIADGRIVGIVSITDVLALIAD